MDLLTTNDQPGCYPASFYAATTPQLPVQPPLYGAKHVDVCVIGAGFTGLSAALHLARAGRSVVVLEAQRVGFGASGRNGGQLGTGQRVDQRALEKMVGRDDARHLWNIALESIDLVKELVAQSGVDCDLQSGVLQADWGARDAASHRAYADHLSRYYNYDKTQVFDKNSIQDVIHSPVYAGGVLDHGGAHLQPLAYALGLAELAQDAGVEIYERSRVTHIEDATQLVVKTADGEIYPQEIVLACNGYLGGLYPQVAARVMPINNFIIATEPLDPGQALHKRVAVADSRFVVNYYRTTPDNRLLFGGGESYGYRFPKDIAALVRKPLAETFPHLADVAITHAWGGTLAITMNRMPYFAKPSARIYSASGYSGHGVAMATLAGKIIAEAVRGTQDRFDIMARCPTQAFPGGVALRSPLLVAAMTWYSLRDKLGL
jgi:gamma-glutamylputrescine oxidase